MSYRCQEQAVQRTEQGMCVRQCCQIANHMYSGVTVGCVVVFEKVPVIVYMRLCGYFTLCLWLQNMLVICLTLWNSVHHYVTISLPHYILIVVF